MFAFVDSTTYTLDSCFGYILTLKRHITVSGWQVCTANTAVDGTINCKARSPREERVNVSKKRVSPKSALCLVDHKLTPFLDVSRLV